MNRYGLTSPDITFRIFTKLGLVIFATRPKRDTLSKNYRPPSAIFSPPFFWQGFRRDNSHRHLLVLLLLRLPTKKQQAHHIQGAKMQTQNVENWQTRLLRVRDVAAVMSVSVPTVWRLSKSGKIPAPKKISDNCTRWSGQELAASLGIMEGGA